MGLVRVITYKGKIKDGDKEKEISCQAGSAKEVIDPEAIATAVQGVCTAAQEGAQTISQNVGDLSKTASSALKVNNISMKKLVEELAQAAASTSGTVSQMLSDIPQEAEDLHNKLQREANKEARDTLAGEGATNITPTGYE